MKNTDAFTDEQRNRVTLVDQSPGMKVVFKRTDRRLYVWAAMEFLIIGYFTFCIALMSPQAQKSFVYVFLHPLEAIGQLHAQLR